MPPASPGGRARGLRGFIPRHVGNGAVLRFLELLRLCGRRAPDAAGSAAPCPGTFLENQNAFGSAPFGRSTVRRAGCEVIAVYNALLALTGKAPPLEALVRRFARDGMLLGGRWGTAPGALRDYFRGAGFAAEQTHDVPAFDALAARHGAALLTVYNDGEDIAQGIHTVCLTRSPAGYVAHNAGGGRPAPPRPSVAGVIAALPGGRAKGLALLGVSADNISSGGTPS